MTDDKEPPYLREEDKRATDSCLSMLFMLVLLFSVAVGAWLFGW